MAAITASTPDKIPKWPIDINTKTGQRFCKDMLSRAQDELFEAKHMLKLAKKHRRLSDAGLFDQDLFVEEIVDAMHYIVETLITIGVDGVGFFDAYKKKHAINFARIQQEFGEKK